MIRLFTGILLLTAAVITPTSAAPPENADPALKPFFESLKIPGREYQSCCDESDCRPVKTRITKEGDIEIFVDSKVYTDGTDTWAKVPKHRILSPRANPLGEPVACWMPYAGVICFVHGVGG